ncbi:hypothetical protein WJX81_006589 [Elliptochloris bilobata]|uniref:Armadillo repeat-containing protein 6 n=1 Tax=Elliptochloris bilobata TaxID=381761 RepID=A0AAW1SC99_9CHLO
MVGITAGRKAISQETFDSAVEENIAEFDMEAGEAVTSAVEEFKLQGVDLSCIIRARGGGNADKHPVAQALACVLQAADTQARKASTAADLTKALAAFTDLVACEDKDTRAQALAVAAKQGAVAHLAALARTLNDHGAANAPALVAALAALAAVLGCDAARSKLTDVDATLLCSVVERHADDAAVVEVAARAAAAAADKHEGNKCALVDAGLGERLVTALGGPAAGHPGAVIAASAALRSPATADDVRPVTSRAFQNGRMLAKAGAPAALLAILQRGDGELARPDVAAAVCGALKRLAVNDEICVEFADAGGVDTCLQVLRQGLGIAAVVRSAAGLLRQLAGSDSVKAALVAGGSLQLIVRALSAQAASPGALEQVMGLLSTLMLRNPEAAAAAAEAGCLEAVLEVMAADADAAPEPGDTRSAAQWAQRQACMALRNAVARSPELRAPLLAAGAEPLLRAAQRRHPAACAEVGAAALRDLGLEDYLVQC